MRQQIAQAVQAIMENVPLRTAKWL